MLNKIGKQIFWVFVGSFLCSCSSLSVAPASSVPPVFAKLNQVKLGEQRTRVVELLGQPRGTADQTLKSESYELLEYEDTSAQPLGYVVISQAKAVVGIFKWIYNNQPEHDFNYFSKKYFLGAHYEDFRSCDQHFATKVKIDETLGVIVWLRGKGVDAIEITSPRYAKLLKGEFFRRCPELQTP